MKEIIRISHIRNYLHGHISKETLQRLVPDIDLQDIAENELYYEALAIFQPSKST